jgi:hypothetical protein
VKSRSEGYFDPLYDVACLAHSVVANVMLETCAELCKQPDRRQWLIDSARGLLDMYLQRQATTGERVRFITYLICSLSGNLKYPRWTPNKDTFWLTLNFIDRLQREIPTKAEQPGAMAG